MKFFLTLAEDPQVWEQAGEAEREAVFAAHAAFDEAVRERGELIAGEALDEAASARTLRPGDAERVVTEGPFVETVEQVGSFYLIDVPDIGVAIEMAEILPKSYTVEVRPVIDISAYDYGDRN